MNANSSQDEYSFMYYADYRRDSSIKAATHIFGVMCPKISRSLKNLVIVFDGIFQGLAFDVLQ